ncbi:hypothetical protein D3C86_1448550 [compost metagenome]
MFLILKSLILSLEIGVVKLLVICTEIPPLQSSISILSIVIFLIIPPGTAVAFGSISIAAGISGLVVLRSFTLVILRPSQSRTEIPLRVFLLMPSIYNLFNVIFSLWRSVANVLLLPRYIPSPWKPVRDTSSISDQLTAFQLIRCTCSENPAVS